MNWTYRDYWTAPSGAPGLALFVQTDPDVFFQTAYVVLVYN